IYNSPDDVIQTCVTYRYDAMKLNAERTYSSTAGTDGMLCTQDDVPTYNFVYTYTGIGPSGWFFNNSPGNDMMWHTADDRCIYYRDYEYDATTGAMKREIMRSCAADALPRTADDATAYVWYFDYEYDASGSLTKYSWRTGSGIDGIWFNTDDNYNQLLTT